MFGREKLHFNNELKTGRQIAITDLYPNLSEFGQAEAEYSFKRYLELVWRIYERTNRENPKLLTKVLKEARLKEKRADI